MTVWRVFGRDVYKSGAASPQQGGASAIHTNSLTPASLWKERTEAQWHGGRGSRLQPGLRIDAEARQSDVGAAYGTRPVETQSLSAVAAQQLRAMRQRGADAGKHEDGIEAVTLCTVTCFCVLEACDLAATQGPRHVMLALLT